MPYWAHSDPRGLRADQPGAHWQLLSEHLANVAKLARHLASLAAPGYEHFHDLAEWAGLLHDLGKYQDGFQQMIRTGVGRCPHAAYGAAVAYAGSDGSKGLKASHIAHAIAGHHAGIPDRTGGGAALQEKVKTVHAAAQELLLRAMDDCDELRRVFVAPPPILHKPRGSFDLFTRMLFSCLIDADRLDTAGLDLEQAGLNASERLEVLLAHIRALNPDASEAVRTARSEILENCVAAAAYPEQLLSLSAPTGGGKTLAAMAFALRRAALQGGRYRRIIIVIPYLSIIEQNAEVYKQVFGSDSVLEHHSGSFERLVTVQPSTYTPAPEPEERYTPPSMLPATENWDAPIIVTTSVRFFESLFSNRPSDLRRVHNIARSIIIFDEVQVLPRELLAPLLDIMKELTDYWGCTAVLSSATQPAFEKSGNPLRNDLRWPKGAVREIVKERAVLHTRLRRVSIEWRLSKPVDWPEVAAWMGEHEQALCVVNLRDHALRLFQILSDAEQGSEPSLFHLSSRMCPAHRLDTIAEIRERLRLGLPCRVVSTQLIEAGVDVDFPVTFRAMGPLDSIIQVAGRTDRGGRLTAALGAPGGRLIVFLPQDHRLPPNAYENATEITQAAAAEIDIQPDDLNAIQRFYERYYTEGADLGARFQQMRQKCEFRTLAEKFEMISARTQDVFVPYQEGDGLIAELRSIGMLTASLRSRLQRFTIGLHPWEFESAQRAVLEEIRSGSNLWAATTGYDSKTGLKFALAAEELIC